MMCLQKLMQLKIEKLQLNSPFIEKKKDNTQINVSLRCKYVQIKVPVQKTQTFRTFFKCTTEEGLLGLKRVGTKSIHPNHLLKQSGTWQFIFVCKCPSEDILVFLDNCSETTHV